MAVDETQYEGGTCWDNYIYQFSLISQEPTPASRSPLTSGKEERVRNDGAGDALTWDRCPTHAPDVVPSNFTTGQEGECWIPNKQPVDESVWGPCHNPACVHLFSPAQARKAMTRD